MPVVSLPVVVNFYVTIVAIPTFENVFLSFEAVTKHIYVHECVCV